MTVRRVVMFGAGASYGAREPRPPLGACLLDYVQRYLAQIDTCKYRSELLVDGEDVKATVTELREELLSEKSLSARCGGDLSFEELVVTLRDGSKNDLLLKLNRLMALALTPPLPDDPRVDCAFVEKRDQYDKFLSGFAPTDVYENVSFITLNYDCLLERAICRTFLGGDPLDSEGQCLCKHVNYRLAEDNSTGVEVLKPHGSINWVPDVLLGDGSLGTGKDIRETLWFDSRGFPNYHKLDAVDNPQGHEKIALAFYAPGKESHVNPGTLLKIRKLALEKVTEAEKIEIIGVSLLKSPGDDPFLDEALKVMREKVRKRECAVRYVNPNCAETERARGYGFEVIEADFEQYVKNGKL